VQRNGRDLDARLMLATLMRHTGRSTEATQQLDAITRFDGAEKWAWEIHHERQSLNEAAL
jgi:hypothetical protein